MTHVAGIAAFESYGDAGKFKVVFKGAPQVLTSAIPYGDAPTGAMQGPRYTTRAALDAAETVRDLLR